MDQAMKRLGVNFTLSFEIRCKEMMIQPDVLTVKGAKYARRGTDDTGLIIEASKAYSDGKQHPDSSKPSATDNIASSGAIFANSKAPASAGAAALSGLFTAAAQPAAAAHHEDPKRPAESFRAADPYWKKPLTAQNGEHGDLVVIHVCDENQQISRDFCCNRSILVENMRYFDRFLGENENGYEDIDISVHCDVEIFEWLMTYIHDSRHASIKIDKTIIISILISSEFLQMDELVEVCVEQVAGSLNDIIRLPIDLSCVSEKLVNRIASLTHPKTLCEVKDKKDKILTKLYKRRVELDFSRKGSGSKNAPSNSRTIASSLTCCRYCGWVYLENFVTSLTCRQSSPSIDFRGRLTSRHAAIPNWSLTAYLKTLHSGGMGWDSIYWHVWAACVVLRGDGITISALEADRYTIDPDGVTIRSNPTKTDLAMKAQDEGSAEQQTPRGGGLSAYAKALSAQLHPDGPPLPFSLGALEAVSCADISSKLNIAYRSESWIGSPTTPSLHPGRPPEVLTAEIFDLLCNQMKHITGLPHRTLLQQTMAAMVQAASRADNRHARLPTGAIDFLDILWGAGQEQYGAVREEAAEGEERRRGRSPARPATRASSLEPRRAASQGLSKARSSGLLPSIVSGAAAAGNASDAYDSDGGAGDGIASMRKSSSALGERRARSSSTGTSKRTVGLAPSSSSAKSKKKDGQQPVEVEVAVISSDREDDESTGMDDFIAKQIDILRSMPADLAYKTSQQRAPVYGVWLTANPLQIQPPALDEMLQVVADSAVPDNKKIEWELDLMREFDERRMDRIERYLISTRQPQAAADMSKGGKAAAAAGKSKGKGDYYRDRGRQAFRCVT